MEVKGDRSRFVRLSCLHYLACGWMKGVKGEQRGVLQLYSLV